jgi:S1-C subfamily serine protease
VTTVDLVIGLAAAGAAAGGWRLGFAARLFGWIGVFGALAIGAYFVAGVVTEFGGGTPGSRALTALVYLVLVASAGQAVGLGVGLLVHRLRPVGSRLHPLDRAAGAVLGVLGVLVIVWMAAPALATARGWMAGAARGSIVVGLVDDVGPPRPELIDSWVGLIADAPSVLDPLTAPPDPGAPPDSAVPEEVDRVVRRSVAKVASVACGRLHEGSGFVAAPGLVVTNAHVVAGSTEVEVTTEGGDRLVGRTVAFDPGRDLAVVKVDGLDAPALPIGDHVLGDAVGVYGHPGGGPLRVAPARIGEEIVAVGSDIYHRDRVRRSVLVLAARLANGDSGAAVVDHDGAVVAVAFAIDPGEPTTAYALTTGELGQVLEGAGAQPVGTGDCVRV